MNAIFLIFLLIFWSMTTAGCEFLYPVACYTDSDNRQKLLVLHQKTVARLELWSLDPITQVATKMLSSSFYPAGISLLPKGIGFSFIDNGRIRIKEFIKRSARSVDIQENVSNIGPITWYGNGLGYFHALHNRHYALFSITPSGDVDRCVARDKTDCLYPSWFKESLFYIERTSLQQPPCRYSIVKQSATDNSIPLRSLCVDFGTRPIIFLSMINNDEGFFLEHASKIDMSSVSLTFLYHHLTRDGENKWHTTHLFSFSIPSTLLDRASTSCLYESIIPLVPRVCGCEVYYVDRFDLSLSLCSYNLITNVQEVVVSPYNSDYFLVPVQCNSLLFFGGSLCRQEQEANTQPLIYINHNDTYCFSLPCIQARL